MTLLVDAFQLYAYSDTTSGKALSGVLETKVFCNILLCTTSLSDSEKMWVPIRGGRLESAIWLMSWRELCEKHAEFMQVLEIGPVQRGHGFASDGDTLIQLLNICLGHPTTVLLEVFGCSINRIFQINIGAKPPKASLSQVVDGLVQMLSVAWVEHVVRTLTLRCDRVDCNTKKEQVDGQSIVISGFQVDDFVVKPWKGDFIVDHVQLVPHNQSLKGSTDCRRLASFSICPEWFNVLCPVSEVIAMGIGPRFQVEKVNDHAPQAVEVFHFTVPCVSRLPAPLQSIGCHLLHLLRYLCVASGCLLRSKADFNTVETSRRCTGDDPSTLEMKLV